MAYFQAIDEVVGNKPALGSEFVMVTDQDVDIQSGTVKKLSADVILTNQPRVACNGGGGALGHPKIFLTLGIDGRVTCPYCSREFVKSKS